MTQKNNDRIEIIKKNIKTIVSFIEAEKAEDLIKNKENICNALNSSLSLIDELYSVAASTRKLALVGNKFVLQQKKGRSKKKIDETKLRSLIDIGITNLQIAKIFKVSEATIRRRLKELDIERKTSKNNTELKSKLQVEVKDQASVKVNDQEPVKDENSKSIDAIQKSNAGFGENDKE